MARVEIVIYDEFKDLFRTRRKWTLITGFPGFGYVGTIATRYLVSKLKAKKVGDILTKYMPDFAALEDYGLMTPYELFAYEDKNLLILVNNSMPQAPERVAYALKFASWFKSVGGCRAIMTGGLNEKFKVENEEFRWLCINGCEWNFNEPQMEKGLYIVGPLATFFTVFAIMKIPTLILLPYTEPSRYDPGAAVVFVRKVSEILGLNVDVNDLLQYSKLVAEAETALKEMLESSKRERGPKPYM